MNYETATDKELEIVLAKLTTTEESGEWKNLAHNGLWLTEDYPNYCTDWNATMPLAVENKVSLIPSINEDYYRALPVTGGIVHDKSPLRAIVICLIKVLESK